MMQEVNTMLEDDDELVTRDDDDSCSETSSAHDHHHKHDDDMTNSKNGGDGGGNTSTSNSHSEDSMENIEEQLTERKTLAVNRLRGCVMLMLVLAAVGVSVTVFILSRRADIEAFEIQYEGNVDKIMDAFHGVFQDMGAISGLANDATAHSEDHTSDWPYQTLTNFHGRGGNARKLSGALYISLNHLVTLEEKEEWENYVLQEEANVYIDEGHTFQQALGVDGFEDPENIERFRIDSSVKVDPLHYFKDDETQLPTTEDLGDGPYLARWETTPVLRTGKINDDLFREVYAANVAKNCITKQAAILSSFVSAPPGSTNSTDLLTSFFATLQSIKTGYEVNYLGDPMAYLVVPVFDSFDAETKQVVGVMKAAIHWKEYFRDILPSNVNGIQIVLESACAGSFTYEIQGKDVFGVGIGDLHDVNYDDFGRHDAADLDDIDDGSGAGLKWDDDGCPYTIHVYPSQKYYGLFITGDAINVTFAVGMVFFYTIILFIFYDRLVESRQRLILAKATKSTAIVASLFPKNVRDRLLKVQAEPTRKSSGMFSSVAPTQRLKTYLGGDTEGMDEADAQPIADLFPHCTVFFADIAGFTAWSSTREPAQVFVLLQAVYQAFDALAKRRRVFKVETIGDSYVAVTGLPEPQMNHAVIMARFAWDCLVRLGEVTKELEVTLGPDTGDLGMRFGLHSGPVTAGVLKGDRARFQLFGDTVNTAARMESTGGTNKIQISPATADCLVQAGKQHWVTPREDAVKAKGKGVLNTFWLHPAGKAGEPSSTGSDGEPQAPVSTLVNDDKRQDRRVDWMVEILLDHVKKIRAVRKSFKQKKGEKRKSKEFDLADDVTYTAPDGVICLDEVQKAMNMHKFNAQAASAVENHDNEAVEATIVSELREYVAIIASSYKDNPFHNFAHACHVTMSVHKLLTRIVTPELAPEKFDILQKGGQELAKELNDFSHGIVHDPMALFAITFSALIHDVDHQGVSNVQLGKEHPEMAEHYRNKSIAEQNSVDVAWDVLMLDKFTELRKFIFETKEELMRFRQLIVNTVLATDIFDKELNTLRRERWQQAFSGNCPDEEINDLRATIVIEHIIQASDVSHTMQHWHVYRKWNASLFKEMYLAYKAGRMGSDPSTFWYQGELGFFDNYVLPLAKKLKECNVFGVSSDEYFNYAKLNRAEWEDRGKEIVQELIADCRS